jgi:hypothetical protein
VKDEWGALSMDMSIYTIPSGVYDAEIVEAKVQQNADGDTLWAFITIEMQDLETGELTSIEDPFMTIAAKDGSPKRTQVPEGLRRLFNKRPIIIVFKINLRHIALLRGQNAGEANNGQQSGQPGHKYSALNCHFASQF